MPFVYASLLAILPHCPCYLATHIVSQPMLPYFSCCLAAHLALMLMLHFCLGALWNAAHSSSLPMLLLLLMLPCYSCCIAAQTASLPKQPCCQFLLFVLWNATHLTLLPMLPLLYMALLSYGMVPIQIYCQCCLW
jgi:hypothetical protein